MPSTSKRNGKKIAAGLLAAVGGGGRKRSTGLMLKRNFTPKKSNLQPYLPGFSQDQVIDRPPIAGFLRVITLDAIYHRWPHLGALADEKLEKYWGDPCQT